MPLVLEESLEIWNPAVVDVRVGSRRIPKLRISAEILGHVLMHQHLQIHVHRAVAADQDIGRDSFIGWHVTVRIGYFVVGGVEGDDIPGMGKRCGGEAVASLAETGGLRVTLQLPKHPSGDLA